MFYCDLAEDGFTHCEMFTLPQCKLCQSKGVELLARRTSEKKLEERMEHLLHENDEIDLLEGTIFSILPGPQHDGKCRCELCRFWGN